MQLEFQFPDLGEGITEGVLVKWLVAPGDQVSLDEHFAVVETDKAVVELPSPCEGTVLKLHFQEGDTMMVGQVMITFETLESGNEKSPSMKDRSEKAKPPAGKTETHEGAPHTRVPKPAIAPTAAPSPASPRETRPAARRVPATPHTRALARKLGVDIRTVTPSGKGGRVTDEDVERAHAGVSQRSASIEAHPAVDGEQAPSTAKTAHTPDEQPKPEVPYREVHNRDQLQRTEAIPLSNLRRTIARNMHHSVQQSAHVTHVDEADVTALVELYAKAKEQLLLESPPFRLSLLPYFIKAAQTTLRKFPHFNASYDAQSGSLLIKHFYNFGIAVDTDEGLIVPVIKNVDTLSIRQLATRIIALAESAKNRSLHLEDLQDGTFTITNIGPVGGLFATPIIRQPELAILGLHAIKERPAVYQGEIAIRKMMFCTITFDHRFIDGADAARFMNHFVMLLQRPELLMLEIS